MSLDDTTYPLMATVSASSADQLYLRVLATLVQHGDKVRPRDMLTRELVPMTYRLTDPRYNIVGLRERRLNYHFMVAEWLWIWFGREDVEMISHYCPNIRQFSDDGKTFYGAYGPRWIEQLDYVINTLLEDPYSRRAVATLWRPNPRPSMDIPCTVSWQFLVRNGRLNMVATMRSSDAWLGLPYDLFNCTMVQRMLAKLLRYNVGTFTLNLGSAHVYDRDMEGIQRVLAGGTTPDLDQRTYLNQPAFVEVPAFDLMSGYSFATAEANARYWGDVDPLVAASWEPFLRVLASRGPRVSDTVTLNMSHSYHDLERLVLAREAQKKDEESGQ